MPIAQRNYLEFDERISASASASSRKLKSSAEIARASSMSDFKLVIRFSRLVSQDGGAHVFVVVALALELVTCACSREREGSGSLFGFVMVGGVYGVLFIASDQNCGANARAEGVEVVEIEVEVEVVSNKKE
jgi:hypothetical protein